MVWKKHFGVIALAVAILSLIFVLSVNGCSDPSNPDNNSGNGDGGGNDDGDWISGWPNNTICTEYGIAGMNAPPVATNIRYQINPYNASSLLITFNGSSTNDNTISSWFTSRGWNGNIQSFEEYVIGSFTISGFTAQYFRPLTNAYAYSYISAIKT